MKKLLGGLCLLPITCIILYIIYYYAGEDLMNMLYAGLFVVGVSLVLVLTTMGLHLLGIID